jgi:hypothetical protein
VAARTLYGLRRFTGSLLDIENLIELPAAGTIFGILAQVSYASALRLRYFVNYK